MGCLTTERECSELTNQIEAGIRRSPPEFLFRENMLTLTVQVFSNMTARNLVRFNWQQLAALFIKPQPPHWHCGRHSAIVDDIEQVAVLPGELHGHSG